MLEARFMFGPGYRLYFGIHEKKLVLLLLGGDKHSQKRDIAELHCRQAATQSRLRMPAISIDEVRRL